MKIFIFLVCSILYCTAIVPQAQTIDLIKLSESPNWNIEPKQLLQNLINSLQASRQEGDVSTCISKISQALNHFMLDPTLLTWLIYSGKGANDLGDYTGCKALSSSYYLHFALNIQGIIGVRLGLCLPKECPVEVMRLTRPYIVEFVNSQSQIKITIDNIVMEDMADYNKNLNRIKPGAIVFLLVGITLITFILVSSILDYHNILKSEPQTVWKKFIGCFSFQRNCAAILSTQNRVDPKLEVLNGIRVLAIGWVILAHSYVSLLYHPVFNLEEVFENGMNNFSMGIVKAGNMAVDVFFFLSGFLASLQLYRAFKNPKNRTIKGVLLCYFHRYIRLFPILIFNILYAIYIQPLLYDSPNTFYAKIYKDSCVDQWPYMLLYINNFTTAFVKLCVAWTWYIMIDMQVFLIMPLLLILYHRSKTACLWVISAIGLASLIIQTAIICYYDFNLSYVKPMAHDSQTMVYIKPYCRILPYLVGMILFFMYQEGQDEENGMKSFLSIQHTVQEKRIVRYLMYLLAFLITFGIVYSCYFIDKYPNDWGSAFGYFHMISIRPLFVIGLSLMIYPVLIGKGQIILSILGFKIFNPLGKLTYGTYMLHMNIFMIIAFFAFQGKFYTDSDVYASAFGIFCLSYVASFVITIIFESPVVQLLKNFIETRPPIRAKKEIEEEPLKTA